MLVPCGKETGNLFPFDRPKVDEKKQVDRSKMSTQVRKLVDACILSGKNEGLALQKFLRKHKLSYVETDSENHHCFYQALRTSIHPLFSRSLFKHNCTKTEILSDTDQYTAVHLKYQILTTMMDFYQKSEFFEEIMKEVEVVEASFMSMIFHFLLHDAWADLKMALFVHHMFSVNISIVCLYDPEYPDIRHFGPHDSVEDATS